MFSLPSSHKRVRFLTGILVCMAVWLAQPVAAQPALRITKADQPLPVGGHLSIFIDSNNAYQAASIHTAGAFVPSPNPIPVFNVVKGSIWVRFSLVNAGQEAPLFLDLQYANISNIDFYQAKDSGLIQLQSTGNARSFDKNRRLSPFYICAIDLPKGDSATYYIRIESKHPVLIPLFVENRSSLDNTVGLQEIAVGIYIGIMLAIFLYNLFLYFSTRDSSYLVYILYLFFLGVAQITLAGYAFKYLWPSYPLLNDFALPLTSGLAGIAGIAFAFYFLRIGYYTPRLKPWLIGLMLLFAASIVLTFVGRNDISYNLLNVTSLVGGIVLLSASWYIARRKKYKPGYFYFLAWLAFLGGLVVFVMRNFNILPYNNVTTYILYVGSAIEGILLSIALADKINILRREKERSQAEALRAAQKNEQLVLEQNATLERKVAERTEELQSSNDNLSTALQNLKDTQIQLVEAEKMASLGQLTAGIAHEINNPINFVKSNIRPLELDINDLMEIIDAYDALHSMPEADMPAKLVQIDKLKKQVDVPYIRTEIKSLVKGIQDGAERTAEIVKGLRTFSRLDESEVKVVDVHEGIDSTLVILKNSLPPNITIHKEYRAQGEIECFPGKLNQVFMNILSNGIQAIKEKEVQGDESITIRTKDLGEDRIEISIKDTGIGMTDEIRQKIFDPFFTTKDVGEGTGLGLSIVYKIIQKHEGRIEVVSSRGNGAEFILSLYKRLPLSAFD